MTTSEQSKVIIEPSAEMTDEEFDALDLAFDESEQAEKPVTEQPRLLWLNGLPIVETNMMAVGLHIKAGIDPYLDETMEGMQVSQYLVQHKRPDKDGNSDPKLYWSLSSCSLIVVAKRVQSPLEMRVPEDRLGIAYGWEVVKDDQGHALMNKRGKEKRQTVLKLRAFVHELYRHGYYHWLPMTLTGFVTDTLLEALSNQYRVLDSYAALRQGQGKNAVTPFYLFSIPLGPGKVKLVGEPPDQGTIYPIVSQIPDHVSKDYLRQHIVPKELIELLQTELLLQTITWSMEESVKIAQGDAVTPDQLAPSAESLSAAPAQTASIYQEDPLIEQAQLTWIEHHYCKDDTNRLHAVCKRFGVAALVELRLSHFKMLVNEVQVQRNKQQ